jgi:hypothetical protein
MGKEKTFCQLQRRSRSPKISHNFVLAGYEATVQRYSSGSGFGGIIKHVPVPVRMKYKTSCKFENFCWTCHYQWITQNEP